MVTVKISGKTAFSSESVLQYNYGEILRIENAPEDTLEVQFSLESKCGKAVRSIGQIVDGALEVEIPDEMLENGDARSDYYIYAFLYWRDEKSGKTLCRITIPIEARPRPGDVIPKGQPKFEEQLVATVLEERKKAEEQAKEAEAWAHGREDYPDQENDNARHYAKKAEESMERTGVYREEVENMKQSVELSQMQVEENLRQTEGLKNQAQTSAENAALSENRAKESENAAADSRTGAETAENSARKYASEALEQKNAVDQKVNEFEELKTSAVKAVNDAGEEKLQKIISEGNSQKQSVESSGSSVLNRISQALQEALDTISTAIREGLESISGRASQKITEIENAGATEITKVANEGEKQVQDVKDEGTRQTNEIKKYAEVALEFGSQVQENTKALGGFSFSLNPDDSGLDITIQEVQHDRNN